VFADLPFRTDFAPAREMGVIDSSKMAPACRGLGDDPRPVGALTMDVEEYFHVENLRAVAPPALWPMLPRRAEGAIERFLDLLDEHATTATFFTLGWVAARSPQLVARIAARGHEIASHGYQHEMLTILSRERFRSDIRRARQVIEDAAGQPVVGYRAPTWSIMPATAWGLDVLIEEGYRYDSSIFPVRHDRYGDPRAPIVPYRHVRPAGSIVEVPPLVLRIAGMRWPAAGGGVLRLLPFGVVRAAVRQAGRDGRPAVLFVHSWEIDPGQPRLRARLLPRLRHYTGLRGVERKLSWLLAHYRFTRVIDVVDAFERTEAIDASPRDGRNAA
jgi:polysaccharide deacetylase family protein (PEP-CTERM system associated)